MTQINPVQSGVNFQPDLTPTRSSAPAASFNTSTISSMAEETSFAMCDPVTGFLTSVKDGVVSTFSTVTGAIYNGFVSVWNTLFGWAYTIGGSSISGDVLGHIAKAKAHFAKPETKNPEKLAEFQKLVQNCVASSQANDEQINTALKELFSSLDGDLQGAIKGAIWNARPEADLGFSGGDYSQMKIDENIRSDVVKNGLRKLIAEMPSAQLEAKKREFDAPGATTVAKLVALGSMMDIELKPAYDELNDEALDEAIKTYKEKLPQDTKDKFHHEVWKAFGSQDGQDSVAKFNENPRAELVKGVLHIPALVFARSEAVLNDASASVKEKAQAFLAITKLNESALEEGCTIDHIRARVKQNWKLVPETLQNDLKAIGYGPLGVVGVSYPEGVYVSFEVGFNDQPLFLKDALEEWLNRN